MKEKIITLVIIVAVLVTLCVCIKYMPLWSSVTVALTSVASFIGGVYAHKWYEQHVKEDK